MLSFFRTRLILQTIDDEDSIRLLGRPDAATLSDGELFLRIDSREPLRLRGFRISTGHLHNLIQPHEAPSGQRDDADDMSMAKDEAEAELSPGIEPSKTGQVQEEDQVSWDKELVGETKIDLGSEGVDLPEAGPVPDEEKDQANKNELLSSDKTSPVSESDSTMDVIEGSQTKHRYEPSVASEVQLGQVDEDGALNSSLLQIRCLGDFLVQSGQQAIQPTGDEGTSYKAWEVLAFLACQPGMVTSKETLLTAVWPDINEERAANRLRVTMVRLRALLTGQVPELPGEVVRCDRDGTCRLDPALVWSDTQEFLEHCNVAKKLPPGSAKSALEAARALYRGDLLMGRAIRFFEWVEDRDQTGLTPRERYREEYFHATLRLAGIFRREGQTALAIPLFKDLLTAEPTLEDVVRELYRCYGEIGDLSSLVREDHRLREALRATYYDPSDPEDDPNDYDPEPETIELFQQIRAELESRDFAGRGEAKRQVRRR